MSCVMGDNVAEEDAGDINTTLLELQDAFATALRNTGVMGKLRAQLRAAAVSVIRGDPLLCAAAVGEPSLPSAMPLEARVALLLIEDFASVYGLRHTLGVFEAESNICLVGEAEREAARMFVEPQCGGNSRRSALERLVASALARGSQEMLQKRQNADEVKEEEEQPMGPLRAEFTASVSAFSKPEKLVEMQQGEEEIEIANSIVAAGLNEYEDSVTYSAVTVSDISCIDELMYDVIESF